MRRAQSLVRHLALPLIATFGPGAPVTISAQSVVVSGGHVVDVRTGRASIRDVVVVDGVIVQVEAEAPVREGLERIDARGRWVVPGLIELHTHTTDTTDLRRALGLGVTSTLTIRTPPDEGSLEDQSGLPHVALPREYTVAGRFTGGFPRLDAGRWNPANPDEAGAYLDVLRRAGYRRIKVWLDDFSLQRGETVQVLPDSVLHALLAGAKARGMQAYVHALEAQWYRAAIRGGATWIIHPMFPDRLTPEDAAALRRQGMGWTTGLSVVLRLGDPRGYARRALADPRLVASMSPETRRTLGRAAASADNPSLRTRPIMVERHLDYLETMAENGLRAEREGVVLSVGSDSPAGFGTHLEMELLREYGFDAPTILRAATLGGAAGLGEANHFGTIEPGRVADLVVLGSDPLEDITNLRDVQVVVKGGHVWSAEDLRR